MEHGGAGLVDLDRVAIERRVGEEGFWRTDLFPPPQGIPYGTHLATYAFCPLGGVIQAVNVCWLVKSPNGTFFKSCDPGVGIGAVWLLKYETLKQFPLTPLSESEVANLGLPSIAAPVCDVPPLVAKLRARRDLDPLRTPGFPDDYHLDALATNPRVASLPGCHELLWGRLKQVIDSTHFTAELLNQAELISGANGDVVTVEILEDKGAPRLRLVPPAPRSMTSGSAAPISPQLTEKLRERAEGAVDCYRVLFELLERRFSREYPQLLLAKHWESFVGLGTVAGCFVLALGLREVSEHFRTTLETVMRERIALRWPGSEAFTQDLLSFASDPLLDAHRSQRWDLICNLAATWVITRCTAGETLRDHDAIVAAIMELFRNESPGLWKSVQDFSQN